MVSLDKVRKLKKGYCKKCNSIAQFGIDKCGDNFLDDYWDWEKNWELDPWEISYASTQKIYLFCQSNSVHGSNPITCNRFSYTAPHVPCIKCNIRGDGKPIKEDSLGYLYPRSLEIWSKKNIISPYEVTYKSHKKVWWKCPEGIHEDYMRTISETLRYDFRCPDCVSKNNSSALQSKVAQYLRSLGYTVKHEYNCSILPLSPTGYKNVKLPFDNEVVELKLIVEVMGLQHYSASSWHTSLARRNGTTPERELLYQQERDEYKRKYAIDHGYEYLDIPYYYEKDDQYKELINEKIKLIS